MLTAQNFETYKFLSVSLPSFLSHSATSVTILSCQLIDVSVWVGGWMCFSFPPFAQLIQWLSFCNYRHVFTHLHAVNTHTHSLSFGGGAPPCIACGAADVYSSCLFACISPPLGSFVHPFLSFIFLLSLNVSVTVFIIQPAVSSPLLLASQFVSSPSHLP